jgi:D-glycero-alpha-D-manno-heptose-7-phosphate kinase
LLISRTPYRISLLGGGTDYPTWFNQKSGAVLSFTIDHYCWIMARRLPPFFQHKNIVRYSITELTKSVDKIKHPAVREILKHYEQPDGWDVTHSGDLPARSGMGSSSSFVVGFINIMYHSNNGEFISCVMDEKHLKKILALEAIYFERDILKENVGCQDQIAASYGGLNLIELNEYEFNLEPILIPMSALRHLQNHLLLCYTKVERTASQIAGTYIKDLDKNTTLHKLEKFAYEGVDCISTGNMPRLGNLLHESWEIKKSLSPATTNATINHIYQTAIDNGAYGGKLLGAGGGGFMLLCAPPKQHQQLKVALKDYGLVYVPFNIEFQGSKIVFP